MKQGMKKQRYDSILPIAVVLASLALYMRFEQPWKTNYKI
jgi:hypothetical protein